MSSGPFLGVVVGNIVRPALNGEYIGGGGSFLRLQTFLVHSALLEPIGERTWYKTSGPYHLVLCSAIMSKSFGAKQR